MTEKKRQVRLLSLLLYQILVCIEILMNITDLDYQSVRAQTKVYVYLNYICLSISVVITFYLVNCFSYSLQTKAVGYAMNNKQWGEAVTLRGRYYYFFLSVFHYKT